MSQMNLVKVCPYCQSEKIVYGIRVKARSVNPVHLGVLGLWNPGEPIYAEMCEDCGSIVWTYVRRTDREWEQILHEIKDH